MTNKQKRTKFKAWMKQPGRPSWSPQEIADAIGVSRQAVYAFLDGGEMRRKNLEKLAANVVFRTDGSNLNALLDENEEPVFSLGKLPKIREHRR